MIARWLHPHPADLTFAQRVHGDRGATLPNTQSHLLGRSHAHPSDLGWFAAFRRSK